MKSKKTLVLGASANPARYSYLAIERLANNGHEVIALGNKPGKVNGVDINTHPLPIDQLDTVTVYLNAHNQQSYYNYILDQHPNRIIFNPGAENEELASLAISKGIKVQEACTLVLLSTDQY